jgi:hypothetical protein
MDRIHGIKNSVPNAVFEQEERELTEEIGGRSESWLFGYLAGFVTASAAIICCGHSRLEFLLRASRVSMADGIIQPAGLKYESRLGQDARWALSEGGRHFDGKSDVHAALRRICGRLDELNIPYAVVGGMALFQHGFRRFTEDVDILVTRDDLKVVHEKLTGLGYVPLFAGSKNLRDTESGVRIEFLLTGDYPGDGKEKPVAFPNPADVGELRDGVRVLNLPSLVELKLASGMTGSDRMKDLADVQELIKVLSLPADLEEQLSPYVRTRYRELWQATRGAGRRYVRLWPMGSHGTGMQDIDGLILALPDDAETLQKMRDDGVVLDAGRQTSGDFAYLVATDPEVAKKYEMHDESDMWGEDGPGAAPPGQS